MASVCKRFKNEIETTDASGDLSSATRAHLELCADCRMLHQRQEDLRKLILGLARIEAPGDFEFRLRARMASASTNGGRRLSLGFTPGIVSVTLAGIFAMAVIAAYFARQESSSNGIAGSSAPSEVSAPAPIANVSPVMNKTAHNGAINSEKYESESESKPRRKRSRGSLRTVVASDKQRSNTVDFVFKETPVISGSNVSLKVSPEPLDVFIRDESGALRRVSMKSVSFGAQNAVGRLRTVPTATASNQEGVW